MAKREPVYTIYGRKELRALASFARQEIIDVLAQMGTVSVPGLAQALGRPADTLYYHLRILHNAGLVETVGSHIRDGRTEALYHARNLNIDYEASRRTNEKELTGMASSMLRLASATSKTRFAIKRSLSEALSASFGPLERPGGLPRKIWRA